MNTTTSERTIEARDDSASVWMLKNGSAMMNASAINTALLQPFKSSSPPPRMADITKVFNISQMGIVTWMMNRDPYAEASTQILHGNSSDGWSANIAIHLPSNSTIDIIMAVADDSMDKVSPSHRHKHSRKHESSCF